MEFGSTIDRTKRQPQLKCFRIVVVICWEIEWIEKKRDGKLQSSDGISMCKLVCRPSPFTPMVNQFNSLLESHKRDEILMTLLRHRLTPKCVTMLAQY